MTQPIGNCPHCGVECTSVRMLAEEVLRGTIGEQKVHSAHRTFIGDCPIHGQVFAAKIRGNHATQKEAQLKRKYKGEIRDAIVAQLSTLGKKRFKRVLDGKEVGTPEEFEAWDTYGGIK